MDMVDKALAKADKTILLATKLGTLDEDDRSKQYQLKTVRELNDALNKLYAKHRNCEREMAAKDLTIHGLHQRVSNQKWWNGILVSVVVAAWAVIGFLVAHCGK